MGSSVGRRRCSQQVNNLEMGVANKILSIRYHALIMSETPT